MYIWLLYLLIHFFPRKIQHQSHSSRPCIKMWKPRRVRINKSRVYLSELFEECIGDAVFRFIKTILIYHKKKRCSKCSWVIFFFSSSLPYGYFTVRRNNGTLIFLLLVVVPVPSSFLWHFSSQQKPFIDSPRWAGALQLAKARVLARIQCLSFKVTVVSSLEGVGKRRQFHALLVAKISLYFESVQIRPFSKFSTYITLRKSWKVISAETRFPDSSCFL